MNVAAAKLLMVLTHHENEATPPDEKTPKTILDALDWSEGDSGEELIERAKTVENAEAASK